jgi:hypothetical protein
MAPSHIILALLTLLPGLVASYDLNAQSVQPPVILFTDIVSGPRTGNSDSSQPGQIAGLDGAIVTVWGKYLGTTAAQVTVGGVPARVYSRGNATAPADLYTRHKMQMVSFQIPSGAPTGSTTIQVSVGGILSNTLPFTIQAGNIYYVKTTGNDSTGNGSWSAPWQTLPAAVVKMSGGDILYACDGVTQTANQGDDATFDLENANAFTSPSQWASQTNPKALIAYPGATVSVGNTSIISAYSVWPGGGNVDSQYWTISKLFLTAYQEAADYGVGFRLIGNHLTAPLGDGETGGIAGGDSTNLYVLGNELTNIGAQGTSKLYHPMYIQSLEADSGPRLPDESNREIGWNYLHDNYAYDGINIYREGASSGFMLNTRVHDNYIINQTGRGMLVGAYLVGPDNYFYNNVIINAGQGPASKYTSDPAFGYVCVDFGAGWSAYPGTTTIQFYNNTLYGCGFTDTAAGISGGMISYNLNNPFVLDFRNNIVQATGWPYIGMESDPFPGGSGTHNIWYGQGAPPTLDLAPLTGNPQLMNPAPPTGDAHLQAGSAAIGAGSTAAPSVTIDFDNVTRPTPPAIGAFEYTGGAAPPPDSTAPSVPSGLSAIAISSSQVNLSWTASTDPDNSAAQIAYKVYRNALQIGSTAMGCTSYSDTGLAPSTTYTYEIAAFDPSGNTSSQSSPVSVTTPALPAMPAISAFTASPASIKAGSSSTLSWSVSSATGLSISGIGTMTGTTISVSPTQTTTYTLTATNSAGSVTAQTTVTVVSSPVISSFTASPASIKAGSSSTLSWSVSSATGLSISGIGTVTGTTISVSPTQTTTYTLTATNSAGSVTAQTTVSVAAPSPAPGSSVISRVQVTGKSGQGSSVTVPINPTRSGDLLVVGGVNSWGSVGTASDSKGDVFATAKKVKLNGVGFAIYYATNVPAGVTSVTVHFPGGVNDVIVAEYSGLSQTAPFDCSQAFDNGTTYPTFTSGTVTTTHADELLWGLAGEIQSDIPTWSAGAGWTPMLSLSGGNGVFAEDRIVSQTGTYAATGTFTAKNSYEIGAMIAAFAAVH